MTLEQRTSRQLPIIYAHGTLREIGQQIGEDRREQIQDSLCNAREMIEHSCETLHLTWEAAVNQARKYMPFASERYPQYVQEMEGLAEGAGVSMDDLSVLTALEAVALDALHLSRCTSVAANQDCTADGHVLVGHNETWMPEDEPDVYLIHAQPSDEAPFLAMSYGGLLPNVGFNAHGIAQCCDTMYPNDIRIGIPRVIVSRAVLNACSITEAIKCTIAPLRAAGYNHLIAHDSGELFNVEVSARSFAILYGEEGYLAHANHYLDPGMRRIEKDPEDLVSAHVRYHRAVRLLRATRAHNLDTFTDLLRDHANYRFSICNHGIFGAPLDREKTIASVIMDLTERKLWAAWGNPCENAYFAYALNC